MLVTVSLATIAALTLYPESETVTSDWRCIVCGTRGAADMVLNMLLFAPLGAGLALAGVRHRKALAIAVFVSGAVELAQVVIPGRDASMGDVLANAAGSGLGFALVSTACYWLVPAENLARWLALGAGFAAAASIVLTGVMLQPQFTDPTYFGQWTPELRHLERYRGTVLQATVGTLPVPSGRLDNSAAVADSLRRGSPVRVRVVAGPPTSRVSALFSIADAEENTILLFGPHGRDLHYSFRMRAESFRLDRPKLIVRGAMDAPVGDTITVSARREARGYCVAIDETTECGLGFTVGSGWTLLQYVDRFPPWLLRGLNVTWVCLLLIPFGYWLRASVSSLLGGAIIVAALLFVPTVTGLLVTPTLEWLGAVAGAGLGIALRTGVDPREEIPAGTFSRGSANKLGLVFGSQPPLTRNAPRYPVSAATRSTSGDANP
jgi:hypothetical protein